MNTPVKFGGFEHGAEGYQTTGCFSSRHAGGAQFAFGDGRVEFVNEDIAYGVYQAASTRAAADGISDTGSNTPKAGCP